MSENVHDYGYMAPLLTPIGDYKTEEWEVFQERIEEFGLEVNYEGTLIYSAQRGNDYGCGIVLDNKELLSEFLKDADKAEVAVVIHEAAFYSCVWYNGTDSDMSELKLESFLFKTGQTPESPVADLIEQAHKSQYEAALKFGESMLPEGFVPPAWEDLTEEQRANIRKTNKDFHSDMQELGKAIASGSPLPKL